MQPDGCHGVYCDGIFIAVEMSYWTVPEEALDSPDQMRPWAKLAKKLTELL